MALGFFRKWQKSIIVIMVALMLSFLVGMTGLRLMCDQARRPGDYSRGASKYGEVTQGQLEQAEKDMSDLTMFLRLDRMPEFVQLRQNGEDASLAYALLLKEAAAAEYEAGDSEIDDYLKAIGLEVDQAEYRKLQGRIDKRGSGTTEPRLRAALARWLTVLRAYQAYQVVSPPSETHLRKLFRDINETLTLQVLKVPADKYVAGMAMPAESQIKKQFDTYRSARPDFYPKGDSFGFGYAQPARVSVSYLLVNTDVIARVTRPADRDVREYFRENSAAFTKEVPIKAPAATTAPSATTQPEVETKTVPMDIDEAWDQVVERLSGWATEAKTEEFSQLIQSKVEAQTSPTSADAKLHENVYNMLIDRAQGAKTLSKTVRSEDIVALRGKTLERAIPALAKAVGIEAICYPWGAEGEFSVSKEIRIPDTLQAGGVRTLEAVLDEITRLVFTTGKEDLEAIPGTKKAATTQPDTAPAPKAPQYPKLKWTACRGLTGVLFPVSDDEGMTILPIRAGTTALLGARELSQNADIGMARSSRRGRGRALVDQAMQANPLVPGQMMYSFTGTGLQRILWQVVKSEPAAILKTPTAAVRTDVIADCKLLEAYQTPAIQAADAIARKARTEGLEAAAKEAGMEAVATGPTSRITPVSPRAMQRQRIMQQAFMNGLPEGYTVQEFMSQIQAYADRAVMMIRPYEYPPSMIDGVDLTTPAARKRFLDRTFDEVSKLVPVEIDKPIAPGSFGPVVVIPMPTERAHFVVQRIGYAPAVADDFKQTERRKLADEALADAAWDARVGFFTYKFIAARAEYKDPRSQTEVDKK